MNFADNFVVGEPIIHFFLKGNLLQISSGLEVILGYYFSPSLVCLNSLEWVLPISVCLNFSVIIRIFFSCVLARLEFAVLVIFVF